MEEHLFLGLRRRVEEAAGVSVRDHAVHLELQGPRSPASVVAVSRTYRALAPVKVTFLRSLSSVNVPVAALLQVEPSPLSSILYAPL